MGQAKPACCIRPPRACPQHLPRWVILPGRLHESPARTRAAIHPTSDHVHEVLRGPMKGIEPDDYKYELLFDRLECLLALTVGHLQAGPV